MELKSSGNIGMQMHDESFHHSLNQRLNQSLNESLNHLNQLNQLKQLVDDLETLCNNQLQNQPQQYQYIIHTINFTSSLSSTTFIPTHNDSIDSIDQINNSNNSNNSNSSSMKQLIHQIDQKVIIKLERKCVLK